MDLRRMDSIGMIAWVRDKEVPRFRGVRCGAGLFGVQKKGTDVLRLIVDRRRANALEVPFRRACCPRRRCPPKNEPRPTDCFVFRAALSSST